MNNRLYLFFSLVIFCFLPKNSLFAQSPNIEYYEIKIYHLENEEQENRVDEFLEKIYLPALNREGIANVGIFKPVEKDTAQDIRIYVFIPYSSIDQFLKIPKTLENDKIFLIHGTDYLNAPDSNPPYIRIENMLLEAFEGMPQFKTSNLTNSASERIYELRSYERATELLLNNKVNMFNNGEIDIFDRLQFNAIFYGKVIVGSRMPNLMYMTSFSNMASRDAHWQKFRDDAKWEELKGKKEYQNNSGKSDIFLLKPVPYSKL